LSSRERPQSSTSLSTIVDTSTQLLFVAEAGGSLSLSLKTNNDWVSMFFSRYALSAQLSAAVALLLEGALIINQKGILPAHLERHWREEDVR
jgi:hypothetical protein